MYSILFLNLDYLASTSWTGIFSLNPLSDTLFMKSMFTLWD